MGESEYERLGLEALKESEGLSETGLHWEASEKALEACRWFRLAHTAVA